MAVGEGDAFDKRTAECEEQVVSSEALLKSIDAAVQKLHEEVEGVLMESFDFLREPTDEEDKEAGVAECSHDTPEMWKARETVWQERELLLADMLSKRDALFTRVYELKLQLQMLRIQQRRLAGFVHETRAVVEAVGKGDSDPPPAPSHAATAGGPVNTLPLSERGEKGEERERGPCRPPLPPPTLL